MSNRRRPRNRKLMTQDALNKVELPTQKDLVIVARKPATIHWGDVPGVDREDDEVIGELVVYDDETYDIVVNDDRERAVGEILGILAAG